MAKSTRGATVRGGRRGRTDIVEVFSRPKGFLLVQVVGLIIRARAELFVAGCVLVVMLWMRSSWGPNAGLVVLIGLAVALFALPWTRRFLVARFWCVLDRHRLRSCLRMAKIRTMNMDGSLPFMLWARPTKIGERVWLWVRAGSSGDDIEDVLSYIAPACLAREARLHRVRKLATVVAIDVIRRDPLTTNTPVTSPLAKLTGLFIGTVSGEGTESIRSASVTDITTEPVTPVVPLPRKNISKTAKPGAESSAAPVSPTVVVSGEDLSDYVD